jgi:hypothetical protein
MRFVMRRLSGRNEVGGQNLRVMAGASAIGLLEAAHLQRPPRQACPAWHACPHPPQLSGSKWVSVHTPSQRTSDPGQPPPPQLLLRHCPLVQTMPQPPQFSGSFEAFTHAPLHWMIGAEHTHCAFTHASPPVHRMPQPPQFSASVWTSVHAPAQLAVGGGQPVEHDPPAHTRFAAQALEQSPQCAGSLASETQMPPQSVWPLGQPHDPAAHTNPGLQVSPQPPQLDGSVAASTHEPPHGTRPEGHEGTQAPAAQTSPASHAAPHLPQFDRSELVLVQTPPQIASPGGHEHLPPKHV